jgi:hypothetical protein
MKATQQMFNECFFLSNACYKSTQHHCFYSKLKLAFPIFFSLWIFNTNYSVLLPTLQGNGRKLNLKEKSHEKIQIVNEEIRQ